MRASESRKHLLNRLTAVSKNMKAFEENDTLDKRVALLVDKIDQIIKSRVAVSDYRTKRNEARAAKEAAELKAKEDALAAELAAEKEEELMDEIVPPPIDLEETPNVGVS